jgi:hypothetical protein
MKPDTLKPGKERLNDTPDMAARRSFVGEDLAITLAVRNGFSLVDDTGSMYSICGGCGYRSATPQWGRDCHACRDAERAARADEIRSEKIFGAAVKDHF